MSKQRKTADAIEIIDRRYYQNNPDRQAALAEAAANDPLVYQNDFLGWTALADDHLAICTIVIAMAVASYSREEGPSGHHIDGRWLDSGLARLLCRLLAALG
jgi:hypothetical protein